jgi:hypothetical protein
MYSNVLSAAGVHRTGLFAYGILRRQGVPPEEATLFLRTFREQTYQHVGFQRIKDFGTSTLCVQPRYQRCNAFTNDIEDVIIWQMSCRENILEVSKMQCMHKKCNAGDIVAVISDVKRYQTCSHDIKYVM